MQVLNNTGGDSTNNLTDILPPLAVVIDQPARLSVSEPIGGGYNVSNPPSGTSNNEPTYSPPWDMPFNVPTNTQQQIYLQRLADPTRGYNATTNPYRTVDTAPIQLYVFNGVGQGDPLVTNPTRIASVQRGDNPLTGAGYFWHTESWPTNPPSTAADTTHVFGRTLQHSLGYLNTAFGTTGTRYAGTPAAYMGAPATPAKRFPWLTWNNRPFVGPLELMLVPCQSSSQLLTNYAAPPGDLFAHITGTTGHHLLNFFDDVQNSSAYLQRIFDYVDVPSRFVGTQTELPVQTFKLNPYDATGREQALMSFFHPPFNQVSNYREPGRININTIPSDDAGFSSSAVWAGLLNDPTGAATPTWQSVIQNVIGASTFNPDSPTFFAKPFRSSGGAPLMLPGGSHNIALQKYEVSQTLLRSTDPTNTNKQPLFAFTGIRATTSRVRAPTSASTHAASEQHDDDAEQRLCDLDHDRLLRSQLGQPDLIHHDGITLEAELGSDTGEVTRHRAFYIYDRTIPVGFEPGQDHNFKEGLLISRFLE